jgi:hypothetical protein
VAWRRRDRSTGAATSETLRQQAAQEGLVPLKAWVKNALDHVIQECMNEPGLEFVWVGDDAVAHASADPSISEPLEQKENILLTAYAAFPLAPIFMIWSFASGSG